MDFLHRFGTFSAVIACLSSTLVAADDHVAAVAPSQDFQLRRQMQPSPAERTAEQEGQIYIYDSLEFGDVEHALDENFDRIQNMMFIRIHHLPETGSGPVEVEDDECD